MDTPSNVTEIIVLFRKIALTLMPLVAAVAFFAFIVGVARFINAAGNEKELKESKNFIIWGVVGMFVMVSIWGIITFLSRELGFGQNIFIPQIPKDLEIKK